MEYQKVIDLLYNTPTQMSKFRTKNWIEINDKSRGVYHTNSDIRFNTIMLKSSLWNGSDAYILLKGRIIITGADDDATARQEIETNKGVIFKNCTPFINCKSEINNTEIDNTKDKNTILNSWNAIS